MNSQMMRYIGQDPEVSKMQKLLFCWNWGMPPFQHMDVFTSPEVHQILLRFNLPFPVFPLRICGVGLEVSALQSHGLSGYQSHPEPNCSQHKLRCAQRGILMNNQRHSYHLGNPEGFNSLVPGAATKTTYIYYTTNIKIWYLNGVIIIWVIIIITILISSSYLLRIRVSTSSSPGKHAPT